MHKDLHKWSPLKFFPDWIRLWEGPPTLLISAVGLGVLLEMGVGVQEYCVFSPRSPRTLTPSVSVCTPRPHPNEKYPGGAGAVFVLSNLPVAGVQKANSLPRHARRHQCQMSEGGRVCHMKPGAVENEGKAVCLKSWGRGLGNVASVPAGRGRSCGKGQLVWPEVPGKPVRLANRRWGRSWGPQYWSSRLFGKRSPLASLATRFLSPQAAISILTSFIISAIPLKCLPLDSQLSH